MKTPARAEERILAIDPGYGRMGVAVFEQKNGKPELIFSECFETAAKTPHEERLAALSFHLGELCKNYRPTSLAIERLFFSKNKRTALAVAEARGAIVSSASSHGLAIFEYAPVEVKVAVTGYGRSDKKQVTDMVRRLLKMHKKAGDDEYDAIAIGLTHLAVRRLPR